MTTANQPHPQITERPQDTEPLHAKKLEYNSRYRQRPDHAEDRPSQTAMQWQQGKWCIVTGNQHIDRCMIDKLENLLQPDIGKAMIKR
jgi:hypothetical protein